MKRCEWHLLKTPRRRTLGTLVRGFQDRHELSKFAQGDDDAHLVNVFELAFGLTGDELIGALSCGQLGLGGLYLVLSDVLLLLGELERLGLGGVVLQDLVEGPFDALGLVDLVLVVEIQRDCQVVLRREERLLQLVQLLGELGHGLDAQHQLGECWGNGRWRLGLLRSALLASFAAQRLRIAAGFFCAENRCGRRAGQGRRS